MGFEELAQQIHKNAEAEGRKIIHAAEKNAEKIVEEASKNAEESLKKAKAEAAAIVKQEHAERITSAKLAAKKIISEAKDDAVEAAVEEVWKEFVAAATKKSTYPALLSKLVQEGLSELGAKEAVLYVRDEDRNLVSGYKLAKLPPEYAGGVIVESADGKVRVNKTLDEMFLRKKDWLRKQIYEKLF
ncbi:MAG: V-type ATP synthase subunit E family protein [Candidatus Anstonellaceae archaeon]